jgi:flavin-binding protein dodecin
MEIAKEIEILAESDKSWEDAAQQALIETARTVRSLHSIFLKGYQPVIDNNGSAPYCVNARIWLSYDGE